LKITIRSNVLAVSFLAGVAAGASQDAVRTWTVEELVVRALGHHAELRYYEAGVDAAKGRRTQAGQWKNPELSVDAGSRRISDNGETLARGHTVGVSLAQTFEFPGKASLRKAIADSDVTLAGLGLQQYRAALEGRVRTLALQLSAASANAEAAMEISWRGTALVELLRQRPAAGASQLLELRVIEGSLIELQQSAAGYELAREEARIEINTLLGLPPNQPLSLQGPLEPPDAAPIDPNRILLAALSHNYQLRIRTAELEKAVREVSSARREVAPDFSIGPFYSRDVAGETEENLGATVSMTLPLWDWNTGNIAEAGARRAQADAMLLDARRKVEAEAARRLRAFNIHRRRLEMLPVDTVNQLREAADLADRQYRTGAIGVQLFLEVQREFLNAGQLRYQALQDAWSNWLDLELLCGGVLPPPEKKP
jgi:outer membrane protein, heavy metal efflux system